MNRKSLLWLVVAFALLLTIFSQAYPAQAQDEGFQESFDDPMLPEWEHSREVIVQDGVLQVNSGGFALHIGDWSEIDLSVRVRLSGEGEMVVNYYFRDGERYGLILTPNHLILEKESQGQITGLGEVVFAPPQARWFELKISVDGQQHQVWVDDQLLLTANDSEPLETGAIIFLAMGELTAEFDDLQVSGSPGQFPPPDSVERFPNDEPAQPEPETPQQTGETELPSGTGWSDLTNEFFASQANPLELTTFLINIGLAAMCAYILSLVYIHWGTSLSNRRKFAANFMLMTITTTFIILVVRSSVALSLGLVGALSIVRFRTAIKEPEELAYLFFAIGLGIGLGDNQRLITLLALSAGIGLIGLRHLFRRPEADVNLYLTVASQNPTQVSLEQVMQALRPHTAKLKLLRLDETPAEMEAAFLIEFKRISDLTQARAALRVLSENLEITFMDNKGLW